MGAIQGSVNSMLGTAAIAAGGIKHMQNQEALKQTEIAKAKKLAENLQLQGGLGMSEEDANKYQMVNEMAEIGAKPNENLKDEYTANATIKGDTLTDPEGKPIKATYTHSQIKEKLGTMVSYQNVQAKIAQDSKFRATLMTVLDEGDKPKKEGGNK